MLFIVNGQVNNVSGEQKDIVKNYKIVSVILYKECLIVLLLKTQFQYFQSGCICVFLAIIILSISLL